METQWLCGHEWMGGVEEGLRPGRGKVLWTDRATGQLCGQRGGKGRLLPSQGAARHRGQSKRRCVLSGTRTLRGVGLAY